MEKVAVSERDSKSPSPFTSINKIKRALSQGGLSSEGASALARQVWGGEARRLPKSERGRLHRRIVGLLKVHGDPDDLVPVLLPTGDLVYPGSFEDVKEVRRLADEVRRSVSGSDDVYRTEWRKRWAAYLLSKIEASAVEHGVTLLEHEELSSESDEPSSIRSKWLFGFEDDGIEPLLVELNNKEHYQSDGGPEYRATLRAITHLKRMRLIEPGEVPKIKGKEVSVVEVHAHVKKHGDHATQEKFGLDMEHLIAAHYYFRLNEDRLRPQMPVVS